MLCMSDDDEHYCAGVSCPFQSFRDEAFTEGGSGIFLRLGGCHVHVTDLQNPPVALLVTDTVVFMVWASWRKDISVTRTW